MTGPFDFHAPSSPFPKYNALSGRKLFDQASELYAWYGSWDNCPWEHAATYEHLSTIMLLTKMHIEGGNFISQEKEERAFSHLLHLCHELFLGNKTDMPQSLQSIIQILTEENAKAKLVAVTIKLEYCLRIRPCMEQTPNAQEDIKRLLDFILSKVTGDLKETQAQIAVSELENILEKISEGVSADEVVKELNEAVEVFCA